MENEAKKIRRKRVVISDYDAEEFISNMMKIRRYEKWMSQKDLPKIIKKNEQRLYDELIEKHYGLDEVYEEYKQIKKKTKLEIVEMALSEDYDIIKKDENGEYRITRCVYKVVNKECGRNVYGGFLFDSEYLAIAYWYKANEIEHPKFDILLRAEYGSAEDKLFYALFHFNDEKGKKDEKGE